MSTIWELVKNIGLPLLIQFVSALIPGLNALVSIPFLGPIVRWFIGYLGGKLVGWLEILKERQGLKGEIQEKVDAANKAVQALKNTTKEKHDEDLANWKKAIDDLTSLHPE